MVKKIVKYAVKAGAIAGGVFITSEFFGSFGQGFMLGTLMKMNDPYALELHQCLLSANLHKPRERFTRWLMTDVATWQSKKVRD